MSRFGPKRPLRTNDELSCVGERQRHNLSRSHSQPQRSLPSHAGMMQVHVALASCCSVCEHCASCCATWKLRSRKWTQPTLWLILTLSPRVAPSDPAALVLCSGTSNLVPAKPSCQGLDRSETPSQSEACLVRSV